MSIIIDMLYRTGHLALPLDSAFSNPTRLAVLRALALARAPMTGRAVARSAHVNHQGAAAALAALERLGFVARAAVGRSGQWRLDRRRRVVREAVEPLFAREAAFAPAVVAAVKTALRGRCAEAFVGGRAAAGRLQPGEALELVVVLGPQGRRAPSEALRALGSLLDEDWALRLSARVLDRKAAAREAALGDLWRLLPTEGPAAVTSRGL